MGNPYKFMIFDFDGTLGNRKIYEERAARDIVDMMPIKDSFVKEAAVHDLILQNSNGTNGYRNTFQYLKEHYNVGSMNAEEYGKFKREKEADYVVLFPDVISTLDKLKDKYTFAVISDGFSVSQHRKVVQSGIASYLKTVVVSGDIGIDKPDSKIFDYCMNQLGACSEECIYVGDVFGKDVLGAYNAGIKPVWMMSFREENCNVDVQIIHHFSELANLF